MNISMDNMKLHVVILSLFFATQVSGIFENLKSGIELGQDVVKLLNFGRKFRTLFKDQAQKEALRKTITQVQGPFKDFLHFVLVNFRSASTDYTKPVYTFLDGLEKIKHTLGNQFFFDLKSLVKQAFEYGGSAHEGIVGPTKNKKLIAQQHKALDEAAIQFKNKYQHQLRELLTDPNLKPHLLLDLVKVFAIRINRIIKEFNKALLPAMDGFEKLFSSLPGKFAKEVYEKIKTGKAYYLNVVQPLIR